MFKIRALFKNGTQILTRRQSSILSAALVISLTYGISMVLGIFRERLLVAKFYTCCRDQLDVYYAAFRLPDLIFQLVVIGAISAAFIPVFSECLTKDKDEANRLASSLINILLLFFLSLSVLIFIFARPFSEAITGSFTPAQIDLMVNMTRVMLLVQVVFLLSNFFSAIIQSNQRFLLPSLSPVVYNLGIILSILLFSSTLGIWSATAGVLLGAIFHLLIQLPLVIKLGFSYSFIFGLKDAKVKKVIRLMLPRTLSLAASQIEATVSLFLATSLSAGSLTLYYLAQKLADLPVRMLGTSIGQAALPTLSTQLAQNQIQEFKDTIRQTFSQIVFLALPMTALFLVLRLQFVRLAYGTNGFPWEATILTGKTLAAITLSIFSQSLIQLLVRSFYSLHDTVTPFLVSLLSVIINVLLSLLFIFVFKMGIFGLALAFSLANFLNFILLFVMFNLRKERFFGKEDAISWTKMAVSSLLAGFASWGTMKITDLFVFETTRVIPLLFLTILSLLTGVVVYLFSSKLLRLKELKEFLALGQKLGKWKSTLFSIEEIIEPGSGS